MDGVVRIGDRDKHVDSSVWLQRVLSPVGCCSQRPLRSTRRLVSLEVAQLGEHTELGPGSLQGVGCVCGGGDA